MMRLHYAIAILCVWLSSSGFLYVHGGGSSGGLTQAYQTVDNAGAALTQRSVLNFLGAGVSCADNAGQLRTDCTISTGGMAIGAAITSATANDILYVGAGPVLAQAGISGLILASTTAIPTAYSGTSCTNQFPRSLNANGAATCATVSLTADVTGTLPVGNGGTGVATLTGLALGNGSAAFSAYGGTSCTNQFPRSLNASGTATCATIDTASVSPALDTFSKSLTIQSPTTAVTNLVQWEFPSAITLTRVACSVDTGTVTIQFDTRAESTPNTAGTNVLTSNLSCSTTTGTTTTFSSAGVSANAPLNLQIVSTSGTPGVVRIHFNYTIN